MRFLRKTLQWLLVVCLLLFTVAAGAAVYLAYARQPTLSGELSHPSLQAEVRVVRDDWGVPHITASSESDAYFALGYAMAQDRLFQLELTRRLAGGMLSEVFGPKAVEADTVVRSFRLRPKAQETFTLMQTEFPHLVVVLEAFCAGLNAARECEPLPLEFAMLLHTPAPFTPVDCLSVGALLPITFADGLRSDPLASMIQQKHPELDINLLFPGYSLELPVTVMETEEEVQAIRGDGGREQSQAKLPKLQALHAWLSALQPFSDVLGPALGSNSWVLSGSRTASGKPILANDPHIGFTNPSIWYEAHLKFGDFESYGYHLPLIPFPTLSHNRDRAWGITMFANDDVDLYVEEFHPDNPRQVKYKGAWHEVVVEEQTIPVRFGSPVTVQVRRTPHGPVITDLLKAISGYEGPDVSLAWLWQNLKYTDMEGFYRMGHARSYEEFESAMRFITSPGLNISYADAEGNIAWWAAGNIPVRPEHVNSKLMLDGASGEDELLGVVPFEQNPHLKNPASGFIATANNLSTANPVGDVRLLEGYWQPTDRIGRIKELLAQSDQWTLEALQSVQTDVVAPAAPETVLALSRLVEESKLLLDEREQQALNLIKNWDGAHTPESTAAAVYQVTTDMLLKNTLEDELGETLFKTYGTIADHWNAMKHWVQDESIPFWDNCETPEPESAAEIAGKSFREAVAFLRAELGEQPEEWAWGKLHQMEFKHPFGYLPGPSLFFNIGPFPAPGGAEIVNNMLYSKGALDFGVIAGPSTRRLIDFGDVAHSYTILPTGNSGNVMSPHYDDQAEMFMRGEYRTVRLTGAQVDENAVSTLILKPEK